MLSVIKMLRKSPFGTVDNWTENNAFMHMLPTGCAHCFKNKGIESVSLSDGHDFDTLFQLFELGSQFVRLPDFFPDGIVAVNHC